MPSWPTRLFLGSSASSNSVANQPHPSADSDSHTDRQRGATRSAVHPRSPPVPPTNNLPNSSVPCRIPQHGRSISHPFPSIFGSGKKKTERGEEGDEDVVDAKALLTGSLGSHTADQTGMARHGAAPNNEGELITGRCATCDSQVRWPKNLHVYRCTVCLMVNDTKPNGPKSTPEDLLETEALHDCGSFKTKVSAEKEKADNVNQGQTKRTVVPYISFQKTQSLIDEGISSYLKGHLEEPEETDARSDDPPTASLQFSSNQPSAAVQGESSPENRGLLDPFRTVVNNQSAVLNRGTLDNLASTDHRALRPLPTSSGRGADTSDWHSPAESQMQPQSPSRPPPLPPVTLSDSPIQLSAKGSGRSRSDSSKSIFRSLENYIIACFSGIECLNASFPLISPPLPSRAKSDGLMIPISSSPTSAIISQGETPLSPLDAKTLLLGDFAENGTWWTGAARTVRSRSQKDINTLPEHARGGRVGTKSPRINWKDLYHWYHVVLNAGHSWKELAIKCETKISQELKMFKVGDPELQKLIERDLKEASLHLQRTLLKASETLLKRPGRPLKTPADCRFLLVLLNNPLLYPRNNDNPPWASPAAEELSPKRNNGSIHIKPRGLSPSSATDPSRPVRGRPKTTVTPNHSAITKRILGLLANLPIECHHYLVAWFSRFSEGHVRKLVELVSSFVTYRLSRQHSRKRSHGHGPPSELVPNLTGSGMGSSAQLHAALGLAGATKPPEERTGSVSYEEDWQIKAAARIMSLLFSANNNVTYRRSHSAEPPDVHGDPSMASSAASHSANKYGQMLPTSVFYNTLLDYSDLIADFEAWESRKAKFSFCQYPMFLSIWAKIRIMEHDARRQMEIKAREAFFDSIMNRKAVSQHVVLRVRRDCLVEDSLRGVSEVVGTGQEEIKKGLRIEFLHEEGIDAGGYSTPTELLPMAADDFAAFVKNGFSFWLEKCLIPNMVRSSCKQWNLWADLASKVFSFTTKILTIVTLTPTALKHPTSFSL